MDSNPSKSGRGRSTSGRVRGVILSPQGWHKFQTAKQQAESDETWGKHFTQEDLSDRTGLSLNTLTRLFKREQGIDRQSLEYLFRAFGLEVTKADFTSPIAADEASETRQVNPPQDWDTAVDASVFYGRETSREKPRELALMESAQGLVKSLLLSGLSPDDGRAIFRQKGAFTGSEAEWQTLIHHYGGNPLALKLVAAATQDLFNGSITEVMPYLSQGLAVFEDIRDLLARQFNRLSEAEQNILSWFAILREPVAIAEIRENVVDHAVQQNVPNLINSLFRRSLIEKIDGLFFLQPVVMEYVTERFMQQICIEFETQQLNVWQTHPGGLGVSPQGSDSPTFT
jgi:transcriptional regulator with XRE-family HTH domain